LPILPRAVVRVAKRQKASLAEWMPWPTGLPEAMRAMGVDAKLAAFGRAAYYSLAVGECWLLGGAGVIGLMVGSGLPFFPEGGGEP
jgi:hypothetical protein